MIRFNTNTEKEKKDEKRFFTVVYIFVLISGMYTGMYSLRFGVLVDIKQHLEAANHDFPLYFKYLTSGQENNFDDVSINFQFNEYIKLSNQRSRFVYSKKHFIKGRQWFNRDNIYAKADIKYQGKKYKVKAKLFGKNNDHFRHSYRWSFRVKAKEYIKEFKNGKFNLLQPHTRLYVTDMLCNKVLDRHGILSLEYKPINLKINDRPRDVYFVEDFFSKYLIERNGYRDSFIFTFDDIKHPSVVNLTDIQLRDVANIKNDIRKQPDIILDLDKFDKYLALSFLAQNTHPSLVDNFHMFYNSVTNKVEPIIREVWFKKEIAISSKTDLEQQLKIFLQETKRANRNLTTYLQSILKSKPRLEKLINDLHIVAADVEDILKTEQWQSFQDGIFSRYPQAIQLCKNIEPNYTAILELKLKNEVKGMSVNDFNTINTNTVLQDDLILYNTDLDISSGVILDLNGHDIIINSGNLTAVSDVNNRIEITNSSKEPSSIVILKSGGKSLLKNVEVGNLSSLNRSYWHLPAAITFYESNVEMENVSFKSNVVGDDFVNFFRCDDFKLNTVSFINVNADAVDSDFSTGSIEDCTFVNIGNDAIDGSGSHIYIQNSSFNNVEDKVISAGENSTMTISNSKISNSEISFVSKDDSELTEYGNTLINNTLDYCLFSKKKEFDFGILHTDKDISTSKYLIEKGSRIFKGNEEFLNLKMVDSVKSSLYGKEYGKKS